MSVEMATDEKTTAHDAAPNVDVIGDPEKPELQHPSEHMQRGVQDAEAVTLSWSKTSLILVFLNIWALYLVNAFQSSILYDLIPYATSAFESHSLLNVAYIVAGSVSAAVFIPLAKIVDVWGRAEGFLTMIVFATVGLVILASSNGLATFSVGYVCLPPSEMIRGNTTGANNTNTLQPQVFYTIGTSGLTYCVDVITADASKLKNRGLAYAFTSSPYIITAFAGPKSSEGFYENVGWRWGFGAFSIIFPIVAAPLYFILKFNLRKAKQQGTLVEEKNNRTILQTVWFYIMEFDRELRIS
ncbi:hypothetical protein O1611_g7034 [Lasiodiplodia mahajangana]|uniref:Uncharacterized protein n=1 Tax=Lasiodiplodia mahajangana TaxID=1108764 RepID=A0ACC2JGK9_9PEZI|nr:hypothetical protein O1611_g7034 [Lasiodiplodia mahajangana]